MKITSRMLPYEVVRDVKDTIRAQVALDRQDLNFLCSSSQGSSRIDRLSAILEYGAADRESHQPGYSRRHHTPRSMLQKLPLLLQHEHHVRCRSF